MSESEEFTLARAMTAEAMTVYLALERAYCTCDPNAGLDTCGWQELWWDSDG